MASNEYLSQRQINQGKRYSLITLEPYQIHGGINNPARFCLPFYRAVYTIMFKKYDAEVEVQKYLAEAKIATEGSENKELLLEAIGNLAGALKELSDAREMKLDTVKSNLIAYKRYCDRAVDLLDITTEKAPWATKLIRRIIDWKIKELLNEIDTKAKILCDAVSGTKAEDYVYPTCKGVRELTKIRNPIELEKCVDALIPNLRFLGEGLPEAERVFVLNKVDTIASAEYLEDILGLIKELIVFAIPHIRLSEKLDDIQSKVDKIPGMEMGLRRIEDKSNKILEHVQKIESACNHIIQDIEEKGVTLKAEDKHELKTLAEDLRAANKEQLTHFT